MLQTKDPAYYFSLYHNHLEANWKAVLSNGEVWYQADHIRGDSWAQLQEYCAANKLTLEHFVLEFYDNVLNILPPNAEGYFFRRGILSEIMSESLGDNISTPFQGKRSKTFIIGYWKDGLLYTYVVKIPELLVMFGEEVRDKQKQIETKVFDGKALFMRPKDDGS